MLATKRANSGVKIWSQFIDRPEETGAKSEVSPIDFNVRISTLTAETNIYILE